MAARVTPLDLGGSSNGSAASRAASANGAAPSSSNGPKRFARRGMGEAGRMFAVATDQQDNGTPVISVMGEVDLATVPALEEALLGMERRPDRRVIVDLTGCTFLDSTGLRALVGTRERLERTNRRLALVLCTPGVLRVLQITGLDEVFEIYPSLGAAVDGTGSGNSNGDGRWEAKLVDRARPERSPG